MEGTEGITFEDLIAEATRLATTNGGQEFDAALKRLGLDPAEIVREIHKAALAEVGPLTLRAVMGDLKGAVDNISAQYITGMALGIAACERYYRP